MDFFIFISEQYILVGVLLALIYTFVWNEKRRGGKTVSTHELTRMMNNDEAILVDVRDPSDYKTGHIVNALNIPFNKINDRWQELEPHKAKTIILVDKMGQHTGGVGNTLRGKDFQVNRLSGGMSEWEAQNLPVVK
ncbi:rhodanese-like domain-containing protein [Aurantivibrio plasticivorans]